MRTTKGQMVITINKNGRMTLHSKVRKVMEEVLKSEPQAVKVMYDAEQKAVWFRPCARGEVGARSIYNGSLEAKNLLKLMNFTGTGIFPVSYDSQQTAIKLQLK
jgi:hypothetical protein